MPLSGHEITQKIPIANTESVFLSYICMLADIVMKTESFIGFAVALLSATLLFSCVRDRGNGENGLAPGDKLPKFQAVMNDGSVVGVPEDFKGRVSCIVFFNTGCKDCRAELPVIQKLHDEFSDVVFLLVSRAEEKASVDAWWEANGIAMPYSPQPDRRIYELFAKSVIPRIYISDPSGKIVNAYSDSPLPTEDDLRNALSAILGE